MAGHAPAGLLTKAAFVRSAVPHELQRADGRVHVAQIIPVGFVMSAVVKEGTKQKSGCLAKSKTVGSAHTRKLFEKSLNKN